MNAVKVSLTFMTQFNRNGIGKEGKGRVVMEEKAIVILMHFIYGIGIITY